MKLEVNTEEASRIMSISSDQLYVDESKKPDTEEVQPNITEAAAITMAKQAAQNFVTNHPETQKFSNTTKVAKKNATSVAPTAAPVAKKVIEIKPKVAAAIKPVEKPKPALFTKNTSAETQSVQIDSSQDLESIVQLTKNDSQDTDLVGQESATKVMKDVEMEAQNITAETSTTSLADADLSVPKWPRYDEPSLEKAQIEKELKEVTGEVNKWKSLYDQTQKSQKQSSEDKALTDFQKK